MAKNKRTTKQFCDIFDSFISKFLAGDEEDAQKVNQFDRMAPQF